MRLSGSPPLTVVLYAECWGAMGGTGGASLECNGESLEVDFLVRFFVACPLLEADSTGLVVAGERRSRAARLMRDGFFCRGPVSMVGAVVMMLGAAERAAC